MQISLDVVNKRSLEESLDFYCQGELMEGDNQYFCEEIGRKVALISLLTPAHITPALHRQAPVLLSWFRW